MRYRCGHCGKALESTYCDCTKSTVPSPEAIAKVMSFEYVAPNETIRQQVGRKCWEKIHTAKDWTESDLSAWEETIPGYECGGGCKRFYLKYKEDHPPEYDENGHLKFEWGHGLHNAVNTKLEKEVISLERAIEIWQHARNSPSS